MRGNVAVVAACLLRSACATPIGTGNAQSALQTPLEEVDRNVEHARPASARQRLHGRFLHITDIHPDAHYKVHSSTEEGVACHRGEGVAGTYGAETTDCDTPFSLVNETFKWIETHLKDQIDFVVWTGDSARHDSDEKIPRKPDEVLNANRWIVQKFEEVFGDSSDPDKPLSIPVISTFGNNDILPHNILLAGPNKWLKAYKDIWGKFIPEEQRHGFERGGWYYVEVIPQKLAVFSLNTLYFFNNNAAVDGCALRSEPGYEHMEWLRIQLQFMRERGMKAILTGHVPPARTESKQLWDETCWQKYTLWLQQFRDVIVGGLYGHMNIDHFMLHDTKEVDILSISSTSAEEGSLRSSLEDELSIESANDYLEELRDDWSALPIPSSALKKLGLDNLENGELADDVGISKKKKHKSKKKKGKKGKKDPFKKIGGRWGERFQVTNVAPSVVPNFLPTLRVMEYNITGLDVFATWANSLLPEANQQIDWMDEELAATNISEQHNDPQPDEDDHNSGVDDSIAKKKKKHKKPKKPKDPDLIIPSPPTKGSPPGPAYSPQSLTLLGYTQYFANLTHINNDFPVEPTEVSDGEDKVNADRWHQGKDRGNHPRDKIPDPKPFQYQVEYDTFSDPIYRLKDLTVASYLRLAHRIGQYDPDKGDRIDEELLADKDYESDNEGDDGEVIDRDELETGGKKKKKKKHKKQKHHRKDEKNKVWLRFVQRAFVGTLEEGELRTFEVPPAEELLGDSSNIVESHDGEL